MAIPLRLYILKFTKHLENQLFIIRCIENE